MRVSHYQSHKRRCSFLVAKTGWVVLLLMLASSCGWHLRGSIALPDSLKSPFMILSVAAPEVAEALQTQFRDAGAAPVNHETKATIVIEVTSLEQLRKAVAVDSEGRALTYELGVRIRYRFRRPDTGWSEATKGEAIATASFQYDSNQVLSKSAEEVRVKKQLRDDLALRLLQQLSVRLGANED